MEIKVLAVGDPAVYAYTDESLDILGRWRWSGGGAVKFDIVPWDRYLEVLEREFAATRPEYDIVMLPGHLWLPEFVASRRLAPLSDFSAKIPASDWEDLKPFVRDELSYADELYLMPSFTDGHLLFYRTDGAVATPAGRTTTPREIPDLARRNDSSSRRGIALKADPSELFLDWLPYLWAHGGDLLSEEGEPAFDGDEGVTSLELYSSLRIYAPEDTGGYGNEEIARVLREGEVALAVSWGGQAGFIYGDSGNRGYRDNLEAVTLERPWNVVWSFGLLAGATDPAAAFELLRFLSSPEIDRLVGRYAGSPVRRSTYRDEAETVPWYPAQEAMLDRCERLPRHPKMNAILPVVTAALAKVFAGDGEAARELRAAATTVRSILNA